MTHLSAMRIMEIALADVELSTSAERAHLETCEECRESLAAERRLTASIEQIPLRPVPAGFVRLVTSQFRSATRRRYRPFLIAAASLALLICAPIFWLVALNLEPVIGQLALWTSAITALASALITVLEALPLLGAALLAAVVCIALVSTSLLTTLVRVRVK